MARKPARRTARRRRAPLPPIVLALLVLVGLAVVLVERAGWLPSEVREAAHRVEREVFGTEVLRGTAPPAPRVAPPTEAIDYATVRAELERIRVEPEVRRGYVREDWPHWLEAKGCLNAREQVLIDESLEPAALSPDGCAAVSGLWRDPYVNEEVRNPQRLDIDHLIPLEEAHQSGGYDWPRQRRAAFANDLDDPRSLIAVTADANRAKGSKGPEEWLPPFEPYRCRYVADWIAVKARWDLRMDESERVAVGNILAACEAQASGP